MSKKYSIDIGGDYRAQRLKQLRRLRNHNRMGDTTTTKTLGGRDYFYLNDEEFENKMEEDGYTSPFKVDLILVDPERLKQIEGELEIIDKGVEDIYKKFNINRKGE